MLIPRNIENEPDIKSYISNPAITTKIPSFDKKKIKKKCPCKKKTVKKIQTNYMKNVLPIIMLSIIVYMTIDNIHLLKKN